MDLTDGSWEILAWLVGGILLTFITGEIANFGAKLAVMIWQKTKSVF